MARNWLRFIRMFDPVAAGIGSLAVVAAAIGAVSRTWDRDPATVPSRVVAAELPLTTPDSALDLGDVGYRRFIEFPLPITNSGTEAVSVDRFEASCGCTAVSPASVRLEPRETATVWVRVDMEKYSPLFPPDGVFAIQVTIDAIDEPDASSDGGIAPASIDRATRAVRFELTGRVLSPILPSVTSLHFPPGTGLYAGGPPVSRSFTLKAAENSTKGASELETEIRVPTVHCDRGDVRIEPLDDPSRSANWKVTYTPRNGGDGPSVLDDVIRISAAGNAKDLSEDSRDLAERTTSTGDAAPLPPDPSAELPGKSVLLRSDELSLRESIQAGSMESVVSDEAAGNADARREESSLPAYSIEIPVSGTIDNDLHAVPDACHLGWVWAGETFRGSFVVAKYSDPAPVKIELVETSSRYSTVKSRTGDDATTIEVELKVPTKDFDLDDEKQTNVQIVTSDGGYLSVPVTFEWASSKE